MVSGRARANEARRRPPSPVGVLLTAWALAIAAQTSGTLLGTGRSVAAPAANGANVGLQGIALLLHLRGGGRRRKDWQSPRPGDSDEIYSQSASDPSWSAAGDDEDDDDADVRRQIFDGSESDVSESGSYSEQPRQHRHHGRARHAARPAKRPPAQARSQYGAAKSRSRVHHSGRGRRVHSSEDEVQSEVDLDYHAPAQRSRRAATNVPDPGLRWGTAATDALDAVLRGKLGIGASRRRNMGAGSRKTAAGARRRSLYQEPSDDSSRLSMPDPTSSSSEEPRTNARRVGLPKKDAARGGLLDQRDLEDDSWVRPLAPRAVTHAHTAAARPPQALPSYVHNPSSSISDALPSHKRSSSRDKNTPPRATSGHHSPQILEPSPQESRARSKSLSPVCLAEQARQSASSLATLSEADSDSMPADEGDDVGADDECVAGAAVEEVLDGLARRLECEGDAVLLTHTISRVWRGVAVTERSADAAAGADGAKSGSSSSSYHSSCKTSYVDSAPSPSSQSPRYSYDSSPGQASRAHAHVENLHTPETSKAAREASTFVAPVSTQCVLEGLGALMSEAAEAVASAGRREDLAGVCVVVVSDVLMS
jgi:hypothetical protein